MFRSQFTYYANILRTESFKSITMKNNVDDIQVIDILYKSQFIKSKLITDNNQF